MANIHTIQLNIGDLIQDTYMLDAVEFGAYMRLLIAHYSIGEEGIPNDDKKLAKLANVSPKIWNRIKPSVVQYFTWSDAFGIQSRVLVELQKVNSRSSNAKANALKRWNSGNATASVSHSDGNAKNMQTQCNTITSNQYTVNKEEKNTKKEMVLADAKPKIKPKQIKGTRFDEKVTTEEWEIFARDNLGWDKERTQATFNEFNDYWIGVAGAKGVKLDWLATWRNWCRRANEKPYRNNSQIRERGLTAHEKQLEATRNVIARGRSRDSLSE